MDNSFLYQGRCVYGKHKACFNIGHFNMEELGMKYAADWIGELLNNEIPVNYIPTEDGWTFL